MATEVVVVVVRGWVGGGVCMCGGVCVSVGERGGREEGVLTVCLCDVSVHATQPHALSSGGRTPGSQTPGVPATPSPP